MKQQITINKDTPFTVGRDENGEVTISFDQPLQSGDFIYCSTTNNRWICIFDKVVGCQTHYFASINISADIFSTADWFRYEYIKRIATNKEKAKLLEALEKKGFEWDSENLELVEKADKTLVPGKIGIFRLMLTDKENSSLSVGDGLFIDSGTDENKLLCVSDEGYAIFKNSDSLFEKVPCRLVPCKYEDLEFGDTAFRGGKFSDSHKVANYVKILSKGYVFTDKGSAIVSYNTEYDWYKVVPC